MKPRIPEEFFVYVSQLIFLAVAAGISFLVGEYFNLYGEVSQTLEFALNLLFVLLLEIWIFSAATNHRLREGSLILPMSRNNKSNIELVNNLGTLLAFSIDYYSDFQQRLIRKAVSNQLENLRLNLNPDRGFIRFYIESIEDPEIQQLFHLGIGKGDRILATCFSEMDDFWFVPRVGSAYADINWKLIHHERVKMIRIICVNDNDWPKKEIKKRELIRVLQKMGCECRIVTQRALESAGIPKEDMFIVQSSKDKFISLGFKWELSSQGDTSSIQLLFQNKELDDLHGIFTEMSLLSESVPARLPEIEIPATEAAAKDYIEKLSKEYLPTNTIQYLRDPARDYEAIASYWSGLQGTLIRPMASTVEWMSNKIKIRFKDKKPHQYKVAILGCTPELRTLAAQCFPGAMIDIFDLSEVMAKSMEMVIETENPGTVLTEKYLMQNWLTLYHRPREYDLIMGIDVLNMVNRADTRLFLEIVSSLLIDGGAFLTQIVTSPPESYYKNVRNLSFEEAYMILAEAVKDGEISEEEMFVKLGFWNLTSREETVNIGDLLDKIETLEKRISREKRYGVELTSRYELCNSSLSLFAKTEFVDMFNDYFSAVSKPFIPEKEINKKNQFPVFMLGYELTKPKRP